MTKWESSRGLILLHRVHSLGFPYSVTGLALRCIEWFSQSVFVLLIFVAIIFLTHCVIKYKIIGKLRLYYFCTLMVLS